MRENCKISGLPVYKDSKFTDIPVGDNYYVSMSMIGDYIFYAKFRGNLSTVSVKEINRQRDRFLDLFFSERGLNPQEQRVVDIRDCSKISGSPDYQNKIEQKKFFLDYHNRLYAYINCAFPRILSLLYKVGLYLYKLSIPVKFCKNYEGSIHLAMEILKEESLHRSATSIKNQGDYQDKFINISTSILDGYMVVNRVDGFFKEQHLNIIHNIYNEVYKSKEFKPDEYVQIVDLTQLKSNPLALAMRYIKLKNRINKLYNISPKKLIVCSTSKRMMATIKIFKKFIRPRVFFFSSLDKAIKFIKTGKDPVTDKFLLKKKNQVSDKDIQKLLKFIADITWEIENKNIESGASLFPNKHPLAKIAHAITILGDEVKTLIHKEQLHIRKIEKHNIELKTQIAKRKKTELELKKAKRPA